MLRGVFRIVGNVRLTPYRKYGLSLMVLSVFLGLRRIKREGSNFGSDLGRGKRKKNGKGVF